MYLSFTDWLISLVSPFCINKRLKTLAIVWSRSWEAVTPRPSSRAWWYLWAQELGQRTRGDELRGSTKGERVRTEKDSTSACLRLFSHRISLV